MEFPKKFIFCNMGWMEKYEGDKDTGDEVRSTASYIKKHKTGHEVCNFAPDDNEEFVFGSVEHEKINLERIASGAQSIKSSSSSKKDELDGVFVIWTAPHPELGGRVVVGWYKNAIVYRKIMDFDEFTSQPRWHHEKKRGTPITTYNIKAKYADVMLLPPNEREKYRVDVKKDAMGQSAVWYGDNSPYGEELARKIWAIAEGHVVDDTDNSRPDEADVPYTEGGKKEVVVNAYERNEKARKKCVKIYGHKCQICHFDFQDVYGERGKEYIHVHHKKALAEIGEEYEVDAKNDLIPVCPNCHAMIHRRNPMLSVEELADMLKNAKNNRAK